MPSKNPPYRYGYLFVILLTSTALSLTPSMAQSEDKHWIGESDYWTTDINWDPIGTPQSGDSVHIIHADSLNRTILYPHEPIPELDLSNLEIENRGDGHTRLIQEENSLNTNQATIGILGSAQWEQSGGNNFTDNFNLGFEPTGTGIYILENDAHLTTSNEYIGVLGAGEFIQLDGSHTVNAQLTLAEEQDSAGLYELRDGTVRAREAFIGLRGTGDFIQSGGESNIRMLFIGGRALEIFEQDIKGTGTYNLSDGELNTTTLAIGLHGKGTFIQTGGSVAVQEHFFLASLRYGVADGSYILENGNLTSNNAWIGWTATGPAIFTQNDGVHNVTHDLDIFGPSSDSVYNLNAGSLNVSRLISNHSVFNFRGGELITPLFFNGGTLNPVGMQTLSGDFRGLGTLNIELRSGLSDSLTVDGNADLSFGGDINVTLAESFEPHTGDVFDVLIAGSIGGFENINFELPELPLKEIRTYLVDNTIQLRVMSGNFDGDNDIDFSDFMVFAATFGSCEGNPNYLPSADYDADGCITFLDYGIWFGYFQNQ